MSKLILAVWSEDSASDTNQIWKNIGTSVAHHIMVDKNFWSQVEYNSLSTDFSGSYWKTNKEISRAGKQRRVFIRILAAQIDIFVRKKNGILIFHIDGDSVWANRTRDQNYVNQQKNLTRLKKDISYATPLLKSDSEKSLTLTEIDSVFVPTLPNYSIESWLFSNFDLLTDLTTNINDLNTISQWKKNGTSSLDEISKIKEKLTIRDKFNKKLSGNMPIDDLYYVEKSFYSFYLDVSKKIESMIPHIKLDD